jgi:hypothetical protein
MVRTHHSLPVAHETPQSSRRKPCACTQSPHYTTTVRTSWRTLPTGWQQHPRPPWQQAAHTAVLLEKVEPPRLVVWPPRGRRGSIVLWCELFCIVAGAVLYCCGSCFVFRYWSTVLWDGPQIELVYVSFAIRYIICARKTLWNKYAPFLSDDVFSLVLCHCNFGILEWSFHWCWFSNKIIFLFLFILSWLTCSCSWEKALLYIPAEVIAW